MNPKRREFHLPIVGSLLMLTILRLRSTHYQLLTWPAQAAIIICLTFTIQTGLRETHVVSRAKIQAWIEQMAQNRTDTQHRLYQCHRAAKTV